MAGLRYGDPLPGVGSALTYPLRRADRDVPGLRAAEPGLPGQAEGQADAGLRRAGGRAAGAAGGPAAGPGRRWSPAHPPFLPKLHL